MRMFSHRIWIVILILVLSCFCFFWKSEVRDGIEMSSNASGSPLVVQHSGGGAENQPGRKKNHISTGDFKTALEDLEAEFSGEGEKLNLARVQLIAEAAESLSLGDFKRFCDDLRSKPSHDYATSLLAEKFATGDFEAALKWLVTPNSFSPTSTAPAVLGQNLSFEKFPVDVIKALDDRRKSAMFLEGIFGSGDLHLTIEALNYLEDNPDIGRVNGLLLQSAADYFIKERDISSAVTVMEKSTNLESQSSLAARIFGSNFFSPSELVNHLPQREVPRIKAIESVVGRWIVDEPVAASNWVNEMEGVQFRDAGKLAIASRMMQVNLGDSYEWATSISDPVSRSKVIGEIVEHARIKEPQLLKEWGIETVEK